MKVFFEPDDATYIVFRMKEGMRREQMPNDLEGLWKERTDYFASAMLHTFAAVPVIHAEARPTNHFEVRSDGEIAQVWEVSW